ncbi:MAG: hypothetical protein IKE60_24870 [Reyranella sp.]|jgi:hypothetical protein|uniref:hypothetical protein n=1 Tax=Reyranella sp. TaxID=1929291 RepID=UPI00095F9CF4|nr:hypothetical protein [Reyranella sp.]MBR2817918.1 hypothetical protein [Reyranella sp.]OJU43484.1 MAG: hypothetical protein BGN99_15795 [Alphaproteobacteria bacterium 65-37]
MPLHWTIDSRKRLVSAVADGDVARADVENFLQVLERANAMSYRKLVDGSAGDTSMSPEDLLAIGVRIREGHARARELGPLALVLPADKFELVSRVLGILAAADRPMRIFDSLEPARDWIDNLASQPPTKKRPRPARGG